MWYLVSCHVTYGIRCQGMASSCCVVTYSNLSLSVVAPILFSTCGTLQQYTASTVYRIEPDLRSQILAVPSRSWAERCSIERLFTWHPGKLCSYTCTAYDLTRLAGVGRRIHLCVYRIPPDFQERLHLRSEAVYAKDQWKGNITPSG